MVLLKPALSDSEVDEATERALKTLLKFNPRGPAPLNKFEGKTSTAANSPTRSPSAASQRSATSVKSPASPNITLSEEAPAAVDPIRTQTPGAAAPQSDRVDSVRVRADSNTHPSSSVDSTQHRSLLAMATGSEASQRPPVPRRCFLLVRICTRHVKLIYYNFCSETRWVDRLTQPSGQ